MFWNSRPFSVPYLSVIVLWEISFLEQQDSPCLWITLCLLPTIQYVVFQLVKNQNRCVHVCFLHYSIQNLEETKIFFLHPIKCSEPCLSINSTSSKKTLRKGSSMPAACSLSFSLYPPHSTFSFPFSFFLHFSIWPLLSSYFLYLSLYRAVQGNILSPYRFWDPKHLTSTGNMSTQWKWSVYLYGWELLC